MPKLETGEFVNIVGSVDLEKGTGEIIYVNPSTVSISPDEAEATSLGAAPPPGFEIAIQNAQGTELSRIRPVINISTCEEGEAPKTGLINEDIAIIPGMKRLVLLYNGQPVNVFEAGAASPAAPATRSLTMGAAPPDNQHRRTLSSAGTAPAEKGISYTVQVLPEGASAWQTIAVGRQTPAVEFDRNQFPGSRTAQVRILRSTGFEDEVFAQEEINLSD